MKVVIDTNVLMSGIFFGGVPGKILDALKSGRLGLVLSPSVLTEYLRVGDELEARHGNFGVAPILTILVGGATLVDAPDLPEPVARDRDDDKFLACAVAADVTVVVSGDDDLRSLGAWKGVRILSPRQFADEFLSGTSS